MSEMCGWLVGLPAPAPLGLGEGSRLTGVLVLQRAEFRDLVCTVCTTLTRSRQL